MRRCINLLLLSFAIFLAGDGPLSAQQVEQFVSTADLRLAMKRGAVLSLRKGAVQGDGAIEIDESQRFQSMDGFGASITDSAAYLIQQKLTPLVRSQVLQTLFSPTHGMGLSFLRQPIGSEDLSRHHFTFDDMCGSAFNAGPPVIVG